MKRREIIERVAAGLRKIQDCDALLYFDFYGETTWDKETICGIPVYHISTTNPFSDRTWCQCPFIPVSKNEQSVTTISHFLEGYEDYEVKE